MKRKIWIFWLATIVSMFLLSPFVVSAADFPKKPITLIVAYPPGGTTDTTARMFAQVLSKNVAQPVTVINKPGAGTALGTLEVINSEPDGYTLGFFSNALLSSQYTLPDPVDLKGIEPIAMLTLDPATLGVAETTPFKNLGDLISFAKKNPGKLKLAYEPGTATTHLHLVEFTKIAKIDVALVPFKGGGETKVALAGGHVDAAFNPYSTYQPLVDAKKVRIIAVAAERRQTFYPDIPTLKQGGIDAAFGTWHGIFAPKKTPPDIMQTLEKMIEKTAKDKELLDLLNKNSIPIDYRNQQGFVKFLANEDRVYRETATELGLYKPKK